uniref:PNPLA domain-containing protein n=1 Tax=Cairina moschata TaxID=8855 RepID=A0A8C3CWY6_CAIMO
KHDAKRKICTPFSLSFSGSGFLALYQVGVVQSLLELAPELLKSACKVYGSSAGSLIAAAVVCGISLGKEITTWVSLKTILGPLSPKCSLLANIRAVLQRRLPEDSYQVASGRLHISLTRVVDGQNVMVSEFSSKEELIQALLCSCFLPIYCGFIPPSYRGVRYVDGGFTGLQPVSSLEEAVITVSPFTGELDICPRDCPAIFYCFQIFNGSIQISVENLCRISYALFPPSTMVSPPGPPPSFDLGTRTLPFSYAGTVSISPGPEEQPRITTCSAEHSQCSWPNIRHFFSWLTDAFGFNYFDGNFRFASMCGKSDFPQPNGMLNSLSKRVPQYLVPHFLPGRGFRVLTLGFGGG